MNRSVQNCPGAVLLHGTLVIPTEVVNLWGALALLRTSDKLAIIS